MDQHHSDKTNPFERRRLDFYIVCSDRFIASVFGQICDYPYFFEKSHTQKKKPIAPTITDSVTPFCSIYEGAPGSGRPFRLVAKYAKLSLTG